MRNLTAFDLGLDPLSLARLILGIPTRGLKHGEADGGLEPHQDAVSGRTESLPPSESTEAAEITVPRFIPEEEGSEEPDTYQQEMERQLELERKWEISEQESEQEHD